MEDSLYSLEHQCEKGWLHFCISLWNVKYSYVKYVKLNEFLVLPFFSAHWVILKWYLPCYYVIHL